MNADTLKEIQKVTASVVSVTGRFRAAVTAATSVLAHGDSQTFQEALDLNRVLSANGSLGELAALQFWNAVSHAASGQDAIALQAVADVRRTLHRIGVQVPSFMGPVSR